MRLHGRLTTGRELTASRRDEMFALMDRHYENVRRDAFEADLARKDWVILLTDGASGGLCGFSTQAVWRVECEGGAAVALFSGDTVVAREHWGDPCLTHVWGRLALRLMDRFEGQDLYWFLISKGYKTYRFLPVFFHDFDPHPDRPSLPRRRAVLDALAQQGFGDRYDCQRGIVHGTPSSDRLRPGVADVTPERLRDPFVRFFVGRNPGHADGDELCCLAPLTRENFTPAAYRVIGPVEQPA